MIEAELRAGNPDLRGLCLALSDWSAELRLLIADQPKKSRRGGTRRLEEMFSIEGLSP